MCYIRLATQKKSFYAAEQEREDVKIKRENFISSMEKVNPKNIVVIDESGSDLKMTSDYARSQGGERAKAPKPHVSGSKFSIIGVIGTSCIEAAMYVKEAVNLEIFETFVEKFLNPKLSAEKYVIMDNINFHKNEKNC